MEHRVPLRKKGIQKSTDQAFAELYKEFVSDNKMLNLLNPGRPQYKRKLNERQLLNVLRNSHELDANSYAA